MPETDGPRYNMRAVERLTGVPAATLRSWERRYGFPAPARTATARRLYSQQEVDSINWVRAQTARGLTVAQAIRQAAQGSLAHPESAPPGAGAELVDALIDAVSRFDERDAERVFARAFSRFPADAVLLDLIVPALVEIGERWARGELSVSAEHFASQLVRRRLLLLLAQQPVVGDLPVVVLACIPGEDHELGLLMLAVFLRWLGIRPVYLGANVPLDDLMRCISDTKPAAVCLSATNAGAEAVLAEVTARLRGDGVGVPVFAGGAAVSGAALPPDVVLASGDLRQAAAAIAAAARGR
jgi:methanogenic corrinoid protein MtbC1